MTSDPGWWIIPGARAPLGLNAVGGMYAPL